MAFKSAERSHCKFIMPVIGGSMYPASVDIFRWLVQGGTRSCHIEGAYIIISSAAWRSKEKVITPVSLVRDSESLIHNFHIGQPLKVIQLLEAWDVFLWQFLWWLVVVYMVVHLWASEKVLDLFMSCVMTSFTRVKLLHGVRTWHCHTCTYIHTHLHTHLKSLKCTCTWFCSHP